MIESKTQYGLQVRQTGELARIQIIWEDGDSPYYREPVAARLSSDPDCSPFLVDDPDDLANVLVRNTPYYSTSQTLPAWGDFTPDELEAVKVVTTVEITSFDLKLPVVIKPIEKRRVPPVLVKRRLGYLPEAEVGWQVIALLPEGMSRQAAEGLTGQRVALIDAIYQKYAVLGFGDVPEEYSLEVKTTEGVLLILAE